VEEDEGQEAAEDGDESHDDGITEGHTQAVHAETEENGAYAPT